MPMNFADPDFLVDRVTRIWSWRFPNKGETQEQYREAAARYVGLSDPQEAEAIRKSAVFTKFDPPLIFRETSRGPIV
jgi:hypothetical protein